MALTTVADVTARVQDLVDDPAGRRFSPDYIRPKIDSANEDLQILLEQLGVQQDEASAIFNVPAAVSAPLDLTPYFANGQPLQYFLRPRWVDWKLQGQPDVEYTPSSLVSKLADVVPGNVGCQEYCWTGGTLLLTPSYTGVTLRIGFFSLSQTIYDQSTGIMRGIGNLLAYQAAINICALNNNMGKLQDNLEKRLGRAKRALVNLLVMQQQSQLQVARGSRRGGAVQISAGGTPYS